MFFILAAALLETGSGANGMQEAASAQSEAWHDSFLFTSHTLTPYNPVFLGNGYLLETTSAKGTGSPEATLSGVYDHLEQGTYAYQALIPAWNGIDFWDGSGRLDEMAPGNFQTSGYQQRLDAYDGTLSTSYDWLDANHTTHVEATQWVSRDSPHLGVARVQVTPDYGVEVGPVTVSFPIGGEAPPEFVWEGAKLPPAIHIRKIDADVAGSGFTSISETRDSGTAPHTGRRQILHHSPHER